MPVTTLKYASRRVPARLKNLMLALIAMPVFWLFSLSCDNGGVAGEKECGGPGQAACPIEELSCLELPVDQCEANGCEVMLGHRYDDAEQCHDAEEVPVFCRPNSDIDCVWEGHPIILTEPDGSTWYISWSCFTTPEEWEIEYVPGGTPECASELSCLDLPADQCEANGCEVMLGHRYDDIEQCHDAEEVPVFCRPNSDIDCVWEGHPIILTEPDGSTWYISWSCFTTPEEWEIEYVPGGTPECASELSCLDLPADQCEANGCEVMLGHRYDDIEQCHDAEEVPVFCRADNDVVCGWEGDPIILTEPDGSTWYISWSCFTTPEEWEIEYVPAGIPVCN